MELDLEIISQDINSIEDMETIKKWYTEYPPIASAFDTESSGLSILIDKPFLFQFGWTDGITIYVGIVHKDTLIMQAVINMWNEMVKTSPVYLAHNIKFDLSMIENIGVPYPYDNISDTTFYMRFAHDNVSPRQGGLVLKLKEYCAKYIDPSAKAHDKEIQQERMQIAKKYNMQLKNSLGWSMKKIDDFFKDSTNTEEDFPSIGDALKYIEWKDNLPEDIKTKHIRGKLATQDIPYTLVSKDLIKKYGIMDIVWVLKVFLQTEPVIKARGTQEGLNRENEVIRGLYEMERVGFDIDQDYVLASYNRMRTYIRKRRQDLIDFAGFEVTANQNAVLLEFFQSTGLDITGTGVDILSRVHRDYPDYEYQNVIDVVAELRTLEKWLSTYLMRFLGQSKIHTQINAVGAVSLRMSSDFQQFPRGGIKTVDGEELFNPRRAVKVPKNADAIAYLDYSQIELRLQALYTMLVGKPDVHLCRAYMPFECYRYGAIKEITIPYNPDNPEHRATAYTSNWFQNEDNKPWVPTDVHGATAKAAFNIDESHPDFAKLRYAGKTVNFAKNYGAKRGQIELMFPDYDAQTITNIDEGYYKAFPGIKHYQQYCYDLANQQPYATNLFGVRYWNVSGHNLINMLIQGSSASMLKEKIVEMKEFLKPYKTKMLMPIHDEVQFITYDDELHLLPKLKAIMEEWDAPIPIVADMEITRTYWSDKEDYNGV